MTFYNLSKGDRAGIIGCSNGQKKEKEEELGFLKNILRQIGIEAVMSSCIYEGDYLAGAPAKERAEALMGLYRDPSIKMIFDISGGDLANEVLPYLDFETIAASGKLFWGYSDLTVILNAIFTKTGNPSILYQIQNLIYDHAEMQQRNVERFLFEQKTELLEFPYRFFQGEEMEGIVAGGNIRCFLKLAGTEYFPDMTGKILLLEAYSGKSAQLRTYFSQLQQMGIFERISGILLGTFTKMEREMPPEYVVELLQNYVRNDLPIAKTAWIGHGTDSRAIIIGEKRKFVRKNV